MLVNPSNPKALAEAIMKLTKDEELAAKMDKHGKTSVRSCNDIASNPLNDTNIP